MKRLTFSLGIALAVFLLSGSHAWAQPGTLITTIPLAVPGTGVSVAADCQEVIYYTLSGSNNLYKMDKIGTNLGSVPIVTAAGAPLDIDEMAWDETRQVLWGQLHGSNPVDVYTINPTTGVATFAFTSATVSVGTFRDGIAFDGDDTLWISGDVSTTIEHYTSAGILLGSITPKNAAGGTLGLISGVVVGVGDLLYLGRNGAVEIVQVKKSNGDFIASFASPGGTRDEGLECDATSFAPTLALWSREFNPPGHVDAIELEAGTCECGGGGTVTCTLGFWKNHPEEWTNLDPNAIPGWGGGNTYLQIFGISPKQGDASIILAHAYLAAVLNTGAPAADLAAALALLTAHPVGSKDLVAKKNAHPDRALALAVAASLQAFNESATCELPKS
ncbi:MAG TPA: hypothetical protein VGC93_09355 [Thermoanaerobaculia bacterium]